MLLALVVLREGTQRYQLTNTAGHNGLWDRALAWNLYIGINILVTSNISPILGIVISHQLSCQHNFRSVWQTC